MKEGPAISPCNPATFFISGADEERFTFSPGICPYYVTVRAKHHIMLSLLLFATSRKHVRTILKDLVVFANACADKREADRNKNGEHDKHGMDEHRRRSIKALKATLAGRGEYTLSISPAPTDQLYKVGWASNDTIL